jgi:hypothetical protein
MPYSGDPVTQPSTTSASTNVNYMDDGTTGGDQGIIFVIIFCYNTLTIEFLL